MIKSLDRLTRDWHDGPRFPTTRNTLAAVFEERDIDLLIAACNAAGLSAFHFIEERDIDLLIAVCNAAGLSAFHFIGRRMAPLSASLAGVVLPYDHFCKHLDEQGRTVDSMLEKKNFEKAGILLAEPFSNLTIDTYPVTAKYRSPDDPATVVKEAGKTLQHFKC